jgi:hypothetical protein
LPLGELIRLNGLVNPVRGEPLAQTPPQSFLSVLPLFDLFANGLVEPLRHARDAGAREPADFIEAAHDLRVAAEEDRGVLLLEIGESGVGSAA